METKQARVGEQVFRRAGRFSDWKGEAHSSIAQAKKANGLNSRAFDKQSELPPNENRRGADRRIELAAVAEDRRQTDRRQS